MTRHRGDRADGGKTSGDPCFSHAKQILPPEVLLTVKHWLWLSKLNPQELDRLQSMFPFTRATHFGCIFVTHNQMFTLIYTASPPHGGIVVKTQFLPGLLAHPLIKSALFFLFGQSFPVWRSLTSAQETECWPIIRLQWERDMKFYFRKGHYGLRKHWNRNR